METKQIFLQLMKIFYTSTGYNKFITNIDWGTLNSINLNTGKLDWKIPLGQTDIGALRIML